MNKRAALVAVAVLLALGAGFVGGWLVHQPTPPAPTGFLPPGTAEGDATPTSASPPTSSPSIGVTPAQVFTIAHIRVNGRDGNLKAYRTETGSICVSLSTRGNISCRLLPLRGQAVRLAYANWLYLNSACCDFAMFVAGSISPQVASVRVSVGAGRWVDATLLTPPPDLEFPFRLFYAEQRGSDGSLDRRLPVVAMNVQGRIVGRTSYFVQGG